MWWELNGEPTAKILANRPLHKVLSRGGSMGESTSRPIVIWAWVVRHLERLIEELEFHEVCAGRLTIRVGYRNGQAGVGVGRPEIPTRRFDALLDLARPLMRAGIVVSEAG